MLLEKMGLRGALPHFCHISRDDGGIETRSTDTATKRTYVKVVFINRFTGALVAIGKNLPTDWDDNQIVDYVRTKYLRYSLKAHETLDSFRLWEIVDTGKFRHAE